MGFCNEQYDFPPNKIFVHSSHGTSLEGVACVNVRIWFLRPIKYGFFLLSNLAFRSLYFNTRY